MGKIDHFYQIDVVSNVNFSSIYVYVSMLSVNMLPWAEFGGKNCLEPHDQVVKPFPVHLLTICPFRTIFHNLASFRSLLHNFQISSAGKEMWPKCDRHNMSSVKNAGRNGTVSCKLLIVLRENAAEMGQSSECKA